MGFDLKDAEELKCMAKSGDGKYFGATNAEELADALKQAVEEKAGPGLILKVSANGKPVPASAFISKTGSKKEILRDTHQVPAEKKKAEPWRLELDPGSYDVFQKPCARSPSRKRAR